MFRCSTFLLTNYICSRKRYEAEQFLCHHSILNKIGGKKKGNYDEKKWNKNKVKTFLRILQIKIFCEFFSLIIWFPFVPLNLDLAKLDYETRAFHEPRVPQDKTEERVGTRKRGKKGRKKGKISKRFTMEMIEFFFLLPIDFAKKARIFI